MDQGEGLEQFQRDGRAQHGGRLAVAGGVPGGHAQQRPYSLAACGDEAADGIDESRHLSGRLAASRIEKLIQALPDLRCLLPRVEFPGGAGWRRAGSPVIWPPCGAAQAHADPRPDGRGARILRHLPALGYRGDRDLGLG
jgi:hypothetical protein